MGTAKDDDVVKSQPSYRRWLTAMRQIWSLALACLTKLTILKTLEILHAFMEYFI